MAEKRFLEQIGEPRCRTTAMGILPHQDITTALELALSLDIPFWPQLPKLRFEEDMYAQACDGLPGFIVDREGKTIRFAPEQFMTELDQYAARSGELSHVGLSAESSVVFDKFLGQDIGSAWAIRGQIIGPVSFGLKVTDPDKKPVIYDENVRGILFDAFQRKANWQFEQLSKRNPRSFVWFDEPGLEMLWMSMTGYTEQQAKADLGAALGQVEGPRGIHLCGKPDWDFLLDAPIDVLSMDAYSHGAVLAVYERTGEFIREGGVIGWGIVPTHQDILMDETVESLKEKLLGQWARLAKQGLDEEQIARQAILAPATCYLTNPDKTESVERAFSILTSLSSVVREEFGFAD
ncbi:MAG: hypothetical protein GXP25_20390 [Planctomycetes bacterium]|nr:hypothetical protein [Planctomycetota bacterium]